MNIRKQNDYSPLFSALDALMRQGLTQMELYCEVGKCISARPEKGAAVAAANYLQGAYPVHPASPRALGAGCGISTAPMKATLP